MNIKKLNTMLALVLSLGAAACADDVAEGRAVAEIEVPAAEAAAPAPEATEATEATEERLQIDVSRSTVSALGAKLTGQHTIAFSEFSGNLRVVGDEILGVQVEIQVASLDAGEEDLTQHLKSDDFFDVAQFPTATFVSTRIQQQAGLDGATHVVTGDLAMHGITQHLSFPARLVQGVHVEAHAEFVIDRQDFGIAYPGMPDDLIQDNVALTIHVVAQ